MRALKAMDIKEDVKKIAESSDSMKDAFSTGFDLLWDIFDKATENKGEKALYVFLAELFETTPEELADMPIPDFIAGLKHLAEENDLVGFFKSAKLLMK